MIHDPENMSGHSPVFIKVDLTKANNPPEKINLNPRLNWNRSSEEQKEQYTLQLEQLLAEHLPLFACLGCDDVLCENPSHKQDIDKATSDILETMVDCAWENLEHTKGTTGDQKSREFTIPGWNDMVKPYHGGG